MTQIEEGSDEAVEIINIIKMTKTSKEEKRGRQTVAGVIFASGVLL